MTAGPASPPLTIRETGRVVRVAVVGTGAWWGREHARVFSVRPDAELVAVVGRGAPRAAARAAEFGAAPYTDIAAMLAAEQPDLVSVCLPNEHHFDPTMLLIEAGVPLLVEKPLVFSVAEADALLAAAGDQFFAINFNHRFATPSLLAKAAMPELGQLSFASWRFGGEPGDSSHPHANLIETQCHGFDMLEWLCGPIGSVAAHVYTGSGRGASTLTVSVQFTSGAVGSLVGSYDSSYTYPLTQSLEINGADGRVLIEDTVKRFVRSRPGIEAQEVWEAGYFNDRDRGFHTMFERHLDALLPALVHGEAPPIHARAGRRALVLAEAVIASAEQRRHIEVPTS